MNNYDLREAAKRLGVSVGALRTWAIYQNRIAYLRLGKKIVFREDDLAAFEATHRVPALPAEPTRAAVEVSAATRARLSEIQRARWQRWRERRAAGGDA